MDNLKIKKKYLGIIVSLIGLFVFPYVFRCKINESIASYNLIFYFGIFMLFTSKVFIGPLKNESILKKIWISLFFIIQIYLLFTVNEERKNIGNVLKRLFVNIFPAIVLFSQISDEEDTIKISDYWFSFLKVVCYFLIISWCVDKVMGNVIQKFWVNYYNSASLQSMINNNRFVSFYGHSLQNANIMIIFLLWTLIRKSKNISSKNYILNIIIAVVGVSITGSKSALISCLSIIVVFLISIKNFKYVVPMIIFTILIYNTGVFDLTIERLEEGIDSGDITTSRNTALERLVENGIIEFKWLQGDSFKKNTGSLVIALEYPLLRWAYVYGILFALIMFITYFIYPVIKLARKKEIRILLGVIIFMIYSNCFDGIAGFGDNLILYSMNLMLIISLCTNYKKKRD